MSPPSAESSNAHTVRGACHHDCPDTCAWEVTVEGGTAIRLRGVLDHPTTQGQLCPKINRFLDRVYHPDRLMTPLRRAGPKGNGEFEPVGWDEAITDIASRLRDITDRDPQAILQYSFDGTQGLVQKGVMADRFFDALGASDIRRHLCGVTSGLGATDVAGSKLGIDPEDLRLAQTLILWGTNTLVTNRHLWATVEAAKENGATVVVVDPIMTPTAAAPVVDEHFQIVPGTDVALILGMVHVLNSEGLLDEEWLRERTAGWRPLLESAREMDPARAANITGIDAPRIEWLARTYVIQRPAAIRSLIGPEHREHGRDIMRAIAMLPALTGAWRDPGGGLARSTGAYFDTALNMPEGRPRRRSYNMAGLGKVIDDSNDIAALFVHNSNPAVIAPGQEAIIAGLARQNLFTVVIEQFMTDTARYADYVLPATTQLEHLDLVPAWGHLYLSLNKPAIDPCGEALPNTEIFRRLAAAVGLEAPGLMDSDEEMVRQLLDSDHVWMDGITFERLNAEGYARLNLPSSYLPHSGSASNGKQKFQLGSLEYRAGTETPVGNRSLAERYPLMLISRKQHTKFLNANYGGFEKHSPIEGEPRLEISVPDAIDRGISDGDSVEVHNERGSLTLNATISDAVQPGLVSIPFGWWHAATPERRGVNALTNPTVPVDGVGSAFFHETLVEVALVS